MMMIPNIDESFDIESKNTEQKREEKLVNMASNVKAERMDDMKLKELRLFLCHIYIESKGYTYDQYEIEFEKLVLGGMTMYDIALCLKQAIKTSY